jgi:hypothetical protein
MTGAAIWFGWSLLASLVEPSQARQRGRHNVPARGLAAHHDAAHYWARCFGIFVIFSAIAVGLLNGLAINDIAILSVAGCGVFYITMRLIDRPLYSPNTTNPMGSEHGAVATGRIDFRSSPAT